MTSAILEAEYKPTWPCEPCWLKRSLLLFSLSIIFGQNRFDCHYRTVTELNCTKLGKTTRPSLGARQPSRPSFPHVRLVVSKSEVVLLENMIIPIALSSVLLIYSSMLQQRFEHTNTCQAEMRGTVSPRSGRFPATTASC